MLGRRLLLPSLCPVVFACLASHRGAAPPPKTLDTSGWNAGVESGGRVPLTVAVEASAGTGAASAAREAWVQRAPPGADAVHFGAALNGSSAGFASQDAELLSLAGGGAQQQLRVEKAFVDLLLARRGGLAAAQYGGVLYPKERYVQASLGAFLSESQNRSSACMVAADLSESGIPKECLAASLAPSAGPTIFANLSAYHAAPTLFNLHATALLRAHTEGSISNVEVVNHPFPRTEYEASAVKRLDGLVLALGLVFVSSFLPASVAAFAVMERESGAKQQLLLSGGGQVAYWLSNLLFDYTLCLASTALMTLLFEVFRQDAGRLLEVPGVLGLTAMSVVHGLTAVPTSYLVAPLFSKPRTAAASVLAANVALGASVSLAVFALHTAGGPSFNLAAEVIASIFRLLPPCAMGLGALLIGRNHRLAKHVGISAFSGWWVGGMHCPKASAYTWDCTYLVGDEVWMLALEALVFSALTVLAGCASESQAWRRYLVRIARRLPLAPLEDPDVAAESQRVAGLNPRGEVLYVSGASKVFAGDAHAVRGVSIAAGEGEFVGLLGPNGAGKTTLLRLISGELVPSDGHVHLRGLDVVDSISDARRLVGVCPQRDPLFEGLTSLEHLELHARLRGARGEELNSQVQRQLARFGLSALARWRAGQLSGGCRRRLSAAIASLAEPPLLLLDEPTAGMDPTARRVLWSSVQGAWDSRRRSVVVLATHSAEEAELLCSRIAIQVDGSFRRLGSAQRLRSSSCGGVLELSVRLVPPSAEDIESYFQGEQDPDGATRVCTEALLLRARRGKIEALLAKQLAPQAARDGGKPFRLVESSGNFFRYEIAQGTAGGGDQTKPLGEVFKLLEEHRKDLKLEDMQLSQGSLSQALRYAVAGGAGLAAAQPGAVGGRGALAARGTGRDKFVAVDLSTRDKSESAFSGTDIGEMTAELDAAV